MRIERQIRFLGMDRSEALETAIRDRIARLERHAAAIVGCRVAVEIDQRHPRQGRPVRVRVDLTLPGRELVVDRVAGEDAWVALRDAFDDMGRRLDEALRQRRGKVKHHAPERHGVVGRLDVEAGYGFIRTHEGEEYYFGRSNLAGLRFERLDVGDHVRFIVEAASDGLQAHRVRPGAMAMAARPEPPRRQAQAMRPVRHIDRPAPASASSAASAAKANVISVCRRSSTSCEPRPS